MSTKTANTISNDKLQASLQTGLGLEQQNAISEQQASVKKAQAPVPSVLQPAKQDSRIFLMQNDKRQGNLQLPLQDVVFDPATNRQRAMRVLRGVESIWKDEQPTTTYPESYVDKNIVYMNFDKGRAIVPTYEQNTLKGIELSNNNMSNPNRFGVKKLYFKEWNSMEESQKDIARQDLVIRAMKMAFEADAQNMVQHASYLNIPFHDEQGVQFTDEALRAAYLRYANNDPAKFLKSIESPTVKIAFKIKNAVQTGEIDLTLSEGAAYWSDGGFITAIPEGRDSVEYLVEFAMIHGEANAAFASRING